MEVRLKFERDRVLRARERLGYGIEKVAEEAGTSKNSVLRAEHEGDIRPLTARKIASALGLQVADLIKEEPEVPLGAAPPSQEKLFNNGVLEEERRADQYSPWLDFVNRYADRWEERIKAGDFDLGNVNEFIATIDDLMRTLHTLNAEEQQGLPQQPYSFGVPAAKTGVAINRLSELIDPLIAAGAAKFENSELEQRLRQKRAEQEAALEDPVRRTG